MYAIVNSRTHEVMEHVDSYSEAIEVKAQYDEMGSWQDAFGNNEYYGTYEIIMGV